MGYIYENSNPERFQYFCQALLAKQFNQLQCFPVGQPDGGRDGWDPSTKTVLQVKFKRKGDSESQQWMIKALENELPKILKLVERGAEHYLMVTNARGSAHLGGGTVDKVQTWLDANVPVPAQCMWRDDLDRRLDNADSHLKLQYPELLTGENAVQLILADLMGPNRSRQHQTLQAFVAKQYKDDALVKFKQVSLSNELLDLFTDVPVRASEQMSKHKRGNGLALIRWYESLIGQSNVVSPDGREVKTLRATAEKHLYRAGIGAGQLLLSPQGQDHLSRVVLEGAPGQGKSTLAQYVCQVHRARYLARHELLNKVPETYRQSAFRLPIKIDLRDFASFMSNKSPFQPEKPVQTALSLEGFIAHLITHVSGGAEFTVNDVLDVLIASPTLIFLDGLDEVADIPLRRALVEAVDAALTRLEVNQTNLQVVVTSRPSIFGNAPRFSSSGFEILSLGPLTANLIKSYAEKWIVARDLTDKDGSDVRKILAEKLELPHIRELTRNPMQLTILLNLIHSIGHSLPDQRTDLYRRYIELFLTREADKYACVRDNRPVLVGFVQHLAWQLQCASESSRSSGSISGEDLKAQLRNYLSANSLSPDLADELYEDGLERLFVLVPRIEGLYEFEVQPLREFFCARHLYETAPVGTYRTVEPHGDRAQRFEAMAVNPFWLNVTRFYAGSYESGEIGSLVISLEELIKSEDISTSVHCRRVGVALLQDWVFSTKKSIQERLIRFIFDDRGTDLLLNTDQPLEENFFGLAVECGQEVIRNLMFLQVTQLALDTRTYRYTAVLESNGGRELYSDFEKVLTDLSGFEWTQMFRRMLLSGAAETRTPGQVWQSIRADNPSPIDLALRCGAILVQSPVDVASHEELANSIVSFTLQGLLPNSDGFIGSELGIFAYIYDPSAHLMSVGSLVDYSSQMHKSRASGHGRAVSLISDYLSDLRDRFVGQGEFESIEILCEMSRSKFGDTWASYALALRGAGVVPHSATQNVDLVVGDQHSLCRIARKARLKRGDEGWWAQKVNESDTSLGKAFWSAMILVWSSYDNLQKLARLVNSVLSDLSEAQYEAVRRSFASLRRTARLRQDRLSKRPFDLSKFDTRASILILELCRLDRSEVILADDKQERSLAHELRLIGLEREITESPAKADDQAVLAWLKKASELRIANVDMIRDMYVALKGASLSPSVRVELNECPLNYPREAVERALEISLRHYHPAALSDVSRSGEWTFE